MATTTWLFDKKPKSIKAGNLNSRLGHIISTVPLFLDEITHSTTNPKCSAGDHSSHNLHHHQPSSHQVNHIQQSGGTHQPSSRQTAIWQDVESASESPWDTKPKVVESPWDTFLTKAKSAEDCENTNSSFSPTFSDIQTSTQLPPLNLYSKTANFNNAMQCH